jgi:hypothetical protein
MLILPLSSPKKYQFLVNNTFCKKILGGKSLYYWLVVIKVHNPKISKQLSALPGICRGLIMAKTKTTKYDVAKHLRNPEEMAAYLEACLEEANGDAFVIAEAIGDIALKRAFTAGGQN